jgi:hypothetical protein
MYDKQQKWLNYKVYFFLYEEWQHCVDIWLNNKIIKKKKKKKKIYIYIYIRYCSVYQYLPVCNIWCCLDWYLYDISVEWHEAPSCGGHLWNGSHIAFYFQLALYLILFSIPTSISMQHLMLFGLVSLWYLCWMSRSPVAWRPSLKWRPYWTFFSWHYIQYCSVYQYLSLCQISCL